MTEKPNPLETICCAFAEQMEKRRRMMNAIGVDLSENSPIRSVLETFPQSVINCYSCENDDVCLSWLDDNETAETPPGFCPNRDLILALLEQHE